MAIVSTITIGADTYSVYALTSDAVADANSYFAARLDAAEWNGGSVTTLTKQQALITAVRFLDRGMLWSGTQTDTATPQPLEWPRDSATCRGDAVTDGTIPDDFAHGEFELALALLKDAAIQNSPDAGSNLRRAKAGSAEVEFFRPTQSAADTTRFPQVVHELVGCYAQGTTTAPFVDGTDSEAADESSHFSTTDNSYDLSRGFP